MGGMPLGGRLDGHGGRDGRDGRDGHGGGGTHGGFVGLGKSGHSKGGNEGVKLQQLAGGCEWGR